MARKEDYENEWEEAHKVCEKKSEEFKSSYFQLQKVGQKRIDYLKNEIGEISSETPKTKTRDKTQKLEDELYKISEKAEDLSTSIVIVGKGLKDIGEIIHMYKSNETRDQKEKGEYNE